MPFFGERLISITTMDVTAYIAKRQQDTIVSRKAQTVNGVAPSVDSSKPAINRQLKTGN